MGDMSINLASLPMGADPKTDQVVAWDELGRSIYQSPFGVQYFIEATAPPKGSAIRGAYNALVQDPGGTLGAVGKNALAGMWGAVETPMNALRGMPITNGDVWNSAGLVSVGGAGMAAPEGALRSGAMRTTAQSAADDVLAMLKRGDAAKVTDEMMAAADPQTLWAGYDLPMDAASRAQRAKKMGFDTGAYHATGADFQSFQPGWRGSSYLGQTPDGAMRGATYGRLDALDPTSEALSSGGANSIMPLNVSAGDVQGLSANTSAWTSLPDVISEADVPALRDRIAATGAQYWDDVYESVAQRDGSYKYYKKDPPSVPYQDLTQGRDAFGYMLGGFNSGSDLKSLEYAGKAGKRGFLVSDEAGASIVAGEGMPIRSQFARFDPRLSHLKNLSASIMAGGLGLSNLLDYLNSQNGEPQ